MGDHETSPSVPESIAAFDEVLNQFESAWKSGERPRLEDFLARLAGGLDARGFSQLLQRDVEYRRASGDEVRGNDYTERFPDHRAAIERIFSSTRANDRETSVAGTTDFHPRPGLPAGTMAPGAKVGKYRILAPLGQGAFGAVFRARDTELERDVALKFPRLGTLVEQEDIQRFLREARAAGQLKHPHIVPVHDAGEIQGQYYIATDFISGKTLRAVIQHRRQLPRREAVQLVATMATALHHAHNKGIIHRDVKPDNVMIDGNGQPHIMDFGLAHRDAEQDLQTEVGIRLGTPAYMSPEQAKGESHLADARSDLWSLGVILYEMLAGRRPFPGSGAELLRQVQQDDPLPLRQLDATVPRDLETIVLKCLAKSAEQRYPSCQHLADELHRWLRGEPIHARPVGTAERVYRWCRRSPALASLTLTAVMLLVGGTVVASYFAHRASLHAADAHEKTIQARSARHLADRRRYIAEVGHIQRLLEDGRIGPALEMLDSLRPEATDQIDLRNWEWYFFKRLCHAEVVRLQGTAGMVQCLAFTPDGRAVAGGGSNGVIHLWDAGSGKLLRQLVGHQGAVNALKFRGEGKQLFSAGADASVRIWDTAIGKQVASYDQHVLNVTSLAFDPEQRQVGSASEDCLIRIWDAETREDRLVIQAHRSADRIDQVVFSPDGKQIAGALERRGCGVWDAITGATIARIEEPASQLAFFPDGKRLWLTGPDPEIAIRVWNPGNNQVTTIGRGPSAISAAAIHQDGQWLATAGKLESSILLWDVQTGQQLRRIRAHTTGIESLAFEKSGPRLVSSSLSGAIKIWNASRDQEAHTLVGHQGIVTRLAFSPDGKLIATGGQDYSARIWDARTGQLLQTLGRHTIRLLPPEGGRPGRIGSIATHSGHEGPVHGVLFSPDGSRLVTSDRTFTSSPGTIRIWDVQSGSELSSIEHGFHELMGMRWIDRGNRVVLYGHGADAEVWDLASRRRLQSFACRDQNVTHLSVRWDGRVVATAGEDSTIRLWNPDTGQHLRTLRGHTDAVRCVEFSPSDYWLASGSADSTIRLWNLPDESSGLAPEPSRVLRGHSHEVNGLAFSPDLQRLASVGGAAKDRNLKLWDLVTGQEILMLPDLHAPVMFDPTGRRVAASTGPWQTIKVFDANPLDEQPYRLARADVAAEASPAAPAPSPPPDSVSQPKVLGFFTSRILPASRFDKTRSLFKLGAEGKEFLVVVMSLPLRSLIPSPEEFEKLDNERHFPPERFTIKSRQYFRLLLEGHEPRTAILHADWPVATGDGFLQNTFTITRFVDSLPGERRLMAVSWVVESGEYEAGLQVQVRDGPPLPVPTFRIEPPDTRPRQREDLAQRMLAALKQISEGALQEGVTAAEAVMADELADANTTYNAACVLSLASAEVGKDPQREEAARRALSEQWAARAVALLRVSVEKGFNDYQHLRTDEDLASLRERADFQELLANLPERRE